MYKAAYMLVLAFLGISVLITGCSGARVMMPTPNVYLDSEQDVYADLSAPLKSTEVPLFYITDRAPEQDEEGNLRYGSGRSNSLAFGKTVVDLGVDITWDKLVEASRTQQRLKPVKLKVSAVTELVRGPNTPLPFSVVDGRIVEDAKFAEQRDAAAESFRSTLLRQLELTPRKEVFLFVHGYHNTFDDAAFAMAEFWHFLGRIGVPIIYTWPAGYPGIFGYTYDRESSEFTVYHLRQVLGFISSFPEVERIHIIAHSRGTDVAVAALRELTIAARAEGVDPVEKYKIHNFVLAAPDLDLQVATQRIGGDKLALSVNRFTIYSSPADKAIGVASQLFESPRGRVGTVELEDLDETLRSSMQSAMKQLPARFAIINFAGAADTGKSQRDRYGHSYFRDAPTVSSDLVLMLRDDLDPGTPGRPLEKVGLRFWKIPPGYPDVPPAQ
jgi:esterase/lipase superfamily enzyme